MFNTSPHWAAAKGTVYTFDMSNVTVARYNEREDPELGSKNDYYVSHRVVVVVVSGRFSEPEPRGQFIIS